MLKKSKLVALLVVCVMMFGVVEPALAWWGEDTAYGTAVGGATGGFWGAVIGAAVAGAAVIATGGLAAIPLAGAAIGGAALTGATYGAVGGAATGAVVGAVSDKETVNKTAKIASIVAPVVGAGFAVAPFAPAIIATVTGGGATGTAVGTATVGTAGTIGNAAVEGIKNVVNDDSFKQNVQTRLFGAGVAVSGIVVGKVADTLTEKVEANITSNYTVSKDQQPKQPAK